MYHVVTLAQEDFQFAVDLANTMDWNMAIEDFQFMTSIEPEGNFLLLDDDKRIGIASSNSYGTKGWFGNLIVEPTYRSKGAGTTLLQHAINYLKLKGVKSIGLYAYPHLKKFYNKNGFKPDTDFTVLQTENTPKVKSEQLPKITLKQLKEIIEFDEQNFEGKRESLIKSIINRPENVCFYKQENQQIVGYVAATVYETQAWIGPLLCKNQRHDVALNLIKNVLSEIAGKTAYAVICRADEQLLEGFLGFGFRETFSVSRMFLGEAFPKNSVYTPESLDGG